MSKYTADIEIAVRGAQQVDGLIKGLNRLNNSINVVNRNAKLLEGKGFNVASMENYSRAVFKAENAIRKAAQGTKQEEMAVKALVTAIDAENKARARRNFLIAQEVANRRQVIATANAGVGLQGPQAAAIRAGRGPASPIRGTVNMPGSPAALAASAAGAAGVSRSARATGNIFSGRAGGAISSGIIGGGFPLLFGQGPAAAAGGALGGVAGGLLGGGFGFALSIAGTAIGDLITQSETLNKTLAGLNSSLSSTGATSTTTASDIKQLAKDLSITNDEAVQLVGTFSQFGNAQTREALASLFGGVGGAATFETIARAGIDEKNALSSVFELRKVIGNEAATQLALQLDTVGATQTQATLLKLVVERSIQNSVATAKNVQFTDNLLSTWENIVAGVAGALSLAIQFVQKMREGSLLRLPFLDQLASLLGGVKARSAKDIATERGDPVQKRLRAEVDAALKAVRQETNVLGTQTRLQDSMRGNDKAARDAARLAEQRQKQLEAAARLAVSTDTQVKKAAALTEQEKLTADLDQKRMERMVKYETLYKEALSIAEIEYLIAAQLNEITAEQLDYEKALLDIALRQSKLLNQTDPLATLQEEINLLDAKLRGKEEEYTRQQAINKLADQGVSLADAIAQVDTQIALNKALSQQNVLLQMETDLFNSLASNVASAFNSALTTAVQGTEDLGAALQNLGAQLLGTIGNMLIMYGIAQALGAAGGGVGNPQGILSFLAKGFGYTGAADGAYWSGGFQAFADGGMVTSPTMGLVGEGGEAEYIIPASKMRGAMNRYAAGARGSAVIPAGDGEGGMGGTATLAPGAIDVRYTVERINSVDYVTADQFQQGMQQAAQQGAAQGEQRTLRRLQMSTSTRKRLGM